MKKWTVTVGKYAINVIDKEGGVELVEICTQALEYLHDKRLDYAIGPTIVAELDGKLFKQEIGRAHV